jgi:hypothetical protein
VRAVVGDTIDIGGIRVRLLGVAAPHRRGRGLDRPVWSARTANYGQRARRVAGLAVLVDSGNVLELAVATAIVLFGFNSGAALATVVGVLIEVPVMLSVVWIVNNSKGWYERGARVRRPLERPAE